MKIEIDTNKIVENAVSRLTEDDILKTIVEDSRMEDMIDEIFSKEDIKKRIEDNVATIVDAYFSSDEGKVYVIDSIKNEIDNSDLLTDDTIVKLMADFLKKKLELT